MKLIREEIEKVELITETVNGKKNLYIQGIFLQSEQVNRNGRLYPFQIMEREVKRYSKDYVDKGRALGELGHPDGPTINGDRVSHLITEMRREGDNFIGKAKVLSTPMGEIVKTFIDEDVKIGVSTRGLGSVKPNKEGIMEVQNDFHLSTVDVVTDPSAPNAFVKGMMENVEYFYDIASGNWIAQQPVEEVIEEIVETVEKEYKKVIKRIDENVAADLLKKFISGLKN